MSREPQLDLASAAGAIDALPHGALIEWLSKQRWFGAKGRVIETVAVADSIVLDAGPPSAAIAWLDVRYEAAAAERYALSLGLSRTAATEGEIASVGAISITDGTDLEALPRALLRMMVAGEHKPLLHGGSLVGTAIAAMPGAGQGGDLATLPMHRLRGEQSNSSYIAGDTLVLKLLRKLAPGVHPEVEMLEFLTRTGFAHAPQLLGTVTFQSHEANAEPAILALAQSFVPSRGDAWGALTSDLETAVRGGSDVTALLAPLERLGAITGLLHVALASDAAAPDFAPEALEPGDALSVVKSIAARLRSIGVAIAGAKQDSWSAGSASRLRELLGRAAAIEASATAVASEMPRGLRRIRIHGDYHLGQVLAVEGGFVIIDFEGEPAKPLAERRSKASPMRDVAGMLRSFSYAAEHVRQRCPEARHAALLDRWERAARERFLDGYHARVGDVGFLPREPVQRDRTLALFEVDKALYEVAYEIDNRPAWLGVAIEGVTAAVARLARA